MAVAREVKEEAGVVVDPESIRYEASQPWPFPQSLMIGFQAQACQSQDVAKREAALDQLKVGFNSVTGPCTCIGLAHAWAMYAQIYALQSGWHILRSGTALQGDQHILGYRAAHNSAYLLY